MSWLDSATAVKTFEVQSPTGEKQQIPVPAQVQTTHGYQVFMDWTGTVSGFIPELAAAQQATSRYYHSIYVPYMGFMQAVDALQHAGLEIDPNAAWQNELAHNPDLAALAPDWPQAKAHLPLYIQAVNQWTNVALTYLPGLMAPR